MPSDEERREIAAKLRELVADCFDDGEFYDRGEVECVLGLVTDDGAWYEAAGVRRLADLIEPMDWTCHDDGVDAFRCTRCGAFVKRDAVTDLCGPIPIRYCPNCRSRLVGE